MTTRGRAVVDHVEFPSTYARTAPERAAVVDVRDGTTLTYAALEDRSRALAHALWDRGLRPGDHVALVMANRVELYELCWAAHRIGLYYTAVNTQLTAKEARYVVADCGAVVLVVDQGLPGLAAALDHEWGAELPGVRHRIVVGGARAGHEDYEALAARSTGPLPHEGEGEKMLYTSGTTGTPKAVARPLMDSAPGSVFLIRALMTRFGYGEHSVMANFAPLYHSAPLGYGMGLHRLGGSVLISGRFDARECLDAMERYRATQGLFVPTMFSRMLRLPDHQRYDLSALESAAHGAAPCPVSVKRAMLEWWGPIVFEYYAGTEGMGMTTLDAAEWLAHPGSVGRPVSGGVHIVDESSGDEAPTGQTGAVYFSGGINFRYHHDDAKTAAAYGPHGWSTLGDIGHVDADGYLYLTDRTSFTVISGGVNVYPQEAENVLAGHPLVADVAAFGVPHDDLGEQLIAVVELLDPDRAGDETAAELLEWCARDLARQKIPRRIEFADHLPRADNGKLYKRGLVEEYAAREAVPVDDRPRVR